MIVPPFDLHNVTDEELIRWFMENEGDTREEAEASIYYLRNPDEAEGLD